MTAKSRRTVYAIRDAKQLAVLRAPLGYQIVAALEEAGACSVAGLSEMLGRNAESLYYHVHRLVKAGLLVEAREQRARRRTETVYELVAREITVDPAERSPAFLRALEGVYGAALRSAARHLSLALKLERAKRSGPRSATELRQRTVRLGENAAAQLREHLAKLDRFLAKHNDPAAAESYTVTTVLSAVARPARGRGPRAPRRRRRG